MEEAWTYSHLLLHFDLALAPLVVLANFSLLLLDHLQLLQIELLSLINYAVNSERVSDGDADD